MRAKNVLNPEFQRLSLLQHQNIFVVVGKGKGHIRLGNCHALEFFYYVLEFYVVRF